MKRCHRGQDPGLLLFQVPKIKRYPPPLLLFKWDWVHKESMPCCPVWGTEVLVAQSWPAFCDSVDCSPPGSSVHGILQSRMLGWIAISSSRGSSQPMDQTQVPCMAGRFFTTEPPGKRSMWGGKDNVIWFWKPISVKVYGMIFRICLYS